MPTIEGLNEAKERLLDIYGKGGHKESEHALRYIRTHFPRYKVTLEDVMSKVPPGAKVLDLGAAPFLVSECLQANGYEVTGGDYCATDWLDPALLSFDIRQVDCNGERLPIEDDTFDCVLFCEVFEHMNKSLNFTMKEILRIIKPGGLLYLTTPNLKAVRNLVRLMRKGKMPGKLYSTWKGAESGGYMGHIREYTPLEIKDYLPRIGFEDVSVKTLNVYSKSSFETYAWRMISAPFPHGRETITSWARKPLRSGD